MGTASYARLYGLFPMLEIMAKIAERKKIYANNIETEFSGLKLAT